LTSINPSVNDNVVSFINAAESAHFTSLVAQHYTGQGLIVDGGCFLGGSTLALCRGLPSSMLNLGEKRVIALDVFRIREKYIEERLLRSSHDVRMGESFLAIFLNNLSQYLTLVEVRCGDLLRVGRIEKAIEVCVVDIAKNSTLNAYIVRRWMPKLIPGLSLLVHQDFYSPFLPWIAVTMAHLMPYFEIVSPKCGECATFRLLKYIPQERINEAVAIDPLSQLGLRSLAALNEALPPTLSQYLQLTSCLIMKRLNRLDEARNLYVALAGLRSVDPGDKWERWSELVAHELRIPSAKTLP
jgi:hypothetical protein